MKSKIIALLFIMFLGLPLCSFATEYFVTNNSIENSGWGVGADSNDGLSRTKPFKTIGHGVNAMAGGDTLIIADGTYKGTENAIDRSSARPPSGTATNYTKIIAENDGRVILDGTAMNNGPIEVYGNLTVDGKTGASTPSEYIYIKGLVSKNSKSAGVFVRNTKYVKIINCGVVDVQGSEKSFCVDRSSYVLVEGCYSWGYTRYSFQGFHAAHTVFRNCVARFDWTSPNNPIGCFAMYSSTNIEVQNCIAIDSDQNQFWYNVEDSSGCFGAPTTESTASTGPVNFTNCIGVNNNFCLLSSSHNAYPADVHIKNCAGWDIGTSSTSPRAIAANGHMYIDKLTYGDFIATDTITAVFNAKNASNDNYIKNAIFTNFDYGSRTLFYQWDSVNNCNFYNMIGSGGSNISPTNTKTYNPKINGLLYLPRIEAGSQLETDGIGANIVKMYGKPGTLWGEAGYNLLQDGTSGQADIDLWPFPNEDIIREHMKSYAYEGKDGTFSGARGFCADKSNPRTPTGKETLTSYIWEYLGNPIPEDIYAVAGDLPDVDVMPASGLQVIEK